MKAHKFWNKWVTKPEQEIYRGKELTLEEMWKFAEDYNKELNSK